ncbi:YaaR family protein [Niallia sp. Krafla_26]|uniref:YaaR family protein n=1 Tax=Niallia sp. Krafla_26 TaxID=3064703 RepID=UPI003D17A5D9
MEVNRINRTGINKVQKKADIPTESISFTEVMGKKREDVMYAKMTQMMQDIEDQGKVLSQTQTVEDLKRYKKLVKEFMDEAVNNGLKLEEQRGFNRRGRTKVYKIVKEVDKKLIDLTNAVLDKEKNGLKILDMVGEIKGLLINMYT